MSYQTGRSKPMDEITLEDALQYPIWEWALGEEGVDGQDETWQRPVTSTDNVNDEMINPIITIKVTGGEIYGSGEYDRKTNSLSAISIWENGQWTIFSESNVPVPAVFISIPKINGREDLLFKLEDRSSDTADQLP